MLGLILALAFAAQDPRAADAPGPSKALLAYLALFETAEGTWLDPELLPKDDETDARSDESTAKENEPTDDRDDVDPDGQRGDGG